MSLYVTEPVIYDPLGGPAPRSPGEWLGLLLQSLISQQQQCDRFEAYYRGEHPLPSGAPDQAKEAYRRLLQKSRSNWMGLVVDAVTERLEVQGFRMGADQPEGDADAWDLWQRNGLDADSELVHTTSVTCGVSYCLVAPDPDDPTSVRITAEHPSQVIVAVSPGNRRRRLAALKVFEGDDGIGYAYVYLPTAVFRWRKRQKGEITNPVTDVKEWVPVDSQPNPLGNVPVVPFYNRPTMFGGRSELDDLTDIQDRINETLFGRLMATFFEAYKQKWATGLEIPTDPETGEQIQPFKSAIDRLWVAEDPNVKFGEFSGSDLSGYIKAVEADIQHLAAVSRTPPHYLLGQSGAFPSGESLKSTETGLVEKVRRRQRHFGESWEEVIRLAFGLLGDTQRASVTDSEAIWKDPESYTEAERVDALVKMASLGVPREELWARWGASPQQIDRWKQEAGPLPEVVAVPTPPQ